MPELKNLKKIILRYSENNLAEEKLMNKLELQNVANEIRKGIITDGRHCRRQKNWWQTVLRPKVINIHTIEPLDEELVAKVAMETGKVVTVEEHSVIGGLGSAIETLAKDQMEIFRKNVEKLHGSKKSGR